MNHSKAWDLIPWLVNGRTSDAERSTLELHLSTCAACRAEVAAQRDLMDAMKTRALVENMPHASLQKLWARIDAEPAERPQIAVPPARHPRLVTWLAAAVAVQALLLGTLLAVVIRSPGGSAGDAAYRTVSSAPVAHGTPRVRAVFSPAMTLGELQALLERAHLQIAGGPSADGVYTLALESPKDDAKQALLTLRAHPGARFAEPLGP
jgi:anti-sigma factor RsiW